jgi:hypothetical protein
MTSLTAGLPPRKIACGPSWVHAFHSASTTHANTSATLAHRSRHSFHPVYDVCAVCGVTRPQYQANGEPKCAGRQSGFERFIEPDDVPDSKGG